MSLDTPENSPGRAILLGCRPNMPSWYDPEAGHDCWLAEREARALMSKTILSCLSDRWTRTSASQFRIGTPDWPLLSGLIVARSQLHEILLREMTGEPAGLAVLLAIRPDIAATPDEALARSSLDPVAESLRQRLASADPGLAVGAPAGIRPSGISRDCGLLPTTCKSRNGDAPPWLRTQSASATPRP